MSRSKAEFPERFLHCAREIGKLKTKEEIQEQLPGILDGLFACQARSLLVYRGKTRREAGAKAVLDHDGFLARLTTEQTGDLVGDWLRHRYCRVSHPLLADGQCCALGVCGVALGAASYLLLFVQDPIALGAEDPAFEQVADLIIPHLGVVCRRVIQHELPGARGPLRVPQTMSQRENEVLVRICQGWSDVEIAGQLMLSVHTVRDHVKHLLRKLKVSNRVEAAYVAAEFSVLIEDAPNKKSLHR